jgi:hypothetical protein
MLEDIYNFHRSKLVGLKAAAMMAMRERNPAKKKTPLGKRRSPEQIGARP